MQIVIRPKGLFVYAESDYPYHYRLSPIINPGALRHIDFVYGDLFRCETDFFD